MLNLRECVDWYQKKIGQYDKEEWERTIEKRILSRRLAGERNGTVTSSKIKTSVPQSEEKKTGAAAAAAAAAAATAASKPNRDMKTDFIDVDLIRGSTFPKAKPKHGFVTVAKLAFLRLFLLPLFASWWISQTSLRIFLVFLLLYCFQFANFILYFLKLVQSNYSSECFEYYIAAEIFVPFVTMIILSIVHSQIVSTTSSKQDFLIKRKKIEKRTGKTRNQHKRKLRQQQQQQQQPHVPTTNPSETETVTNNNNNNNLLNEENQLLLTSLSQSLLPSTTTEPLLKEIVEEEDEDVEEDEEEEDDDCDEDHVDLDDLVGLVTGEKNRETANESADCCWMEMTTNSDEGTSYSSDDFDDSDSIDNTAATAAAAAAAAAATVGTRRHDNDDGDDDNDGDGDDDDDDERGEEEEDFRYSSSVDCHRNDEKRCGALLNPCGLVSDRVSCTIWEKRVMKKADLSVLDISSIIISRAEELPESMDYLYSGTMISLMLAIIPTFYRLGGDFFTFGSAGSGQATASSGTAYPPLTSLIASDFHFWNTVLLSRSFASDLNALFTFSSELFNETNLESIIVTIAMFERFALSTLFFFLLTVAENTFRQRFILAKLFSHLTSFRRARKSNIPHFRLNKVRNIKAWLSIRSYLKKRGPQRSVEIIVSTVFISMFLLLSFISVEFLKDSGTIHSQFTLEATIWCLGLGIFLLRYMTLGTKINRKYRNLSVLLTEQINLYLQIEQKPHKKDELMVANSVLKLAADLLKELESPFKISGLSANSRLYTITKVVILSALSGVLSEILGFKLKLHKIKIK